MSNNCNNACPTTPDSFVEPICFPSIKKSEFPTCKPLELPSTTNVGGICNLEIPCTSLDCIIANFPIFLTFLVTFPYRFLFCYSLDAILNWDVITLFVVNLINNFVDYATLPLLYFTLGFFNGIDNPGQLKLPSSPLCIACPVNIILPQVYNAIGDFFYVIGFVIGILLYYLATLYNLVIWGLCYLAYFTIEIGVCIAVGLSFIDFNASYYFSIQPFILLQPLLQALHINCACALGTCPVLGIGFCLQVGTNCPSGDPCGVQILNPECSPLPNQRDKQLASNQCQGNQCCQQSQSQSQTQT